jgi:glycosyltransferase involved in cell wall biosynthesis
MSVTLFSIVTAVRNGRADLERTARSLAAQTFRDFEWIVVDGDSSDGTKELLPRLEGVTRFVSERDKGIADAWNKGLALGSGRQVLILNAGDTYDSDLLERMAAVTDDEHITCCHARLVTPAGAHAGEFRALPERLWRGMHLPHNWCAVPRHFYDEYGAYQLLPHAMDYEWFHRFWRRHGVTGFRVLDRALGAYYLGGHSDNNAAAGFAANERIWISHGMSPLLARLLRTVYTLKHRLAQARRPA